MGIRGPPCACRQGASFAAQLRYKVEEEINLSNKLVRIRRLNLFRLRVDSERFRRVEAVCCSVSVSVSWSVSGETVSVKDAGAVIGRQIANSKKQYPTIPSQVWKDVGNFCVVQVERSCILCSNPLSP